MKIRSGTRPRGPTHWTVTCQDESYEFLSIIPWWKIRYPPLVSPRSPGTDPPDFDLDDSRPDTTFLLQTLDVRKVEDSSRHRGPSVTYPNICFWTIEFLDEPEGRVRVGSP